MKFVIGHEYAHHILDHDSDGALYVTSPRRFSEKDDAGNWTGYKRQHQQEFDADSHSISLAEDDDVKYRLFLGGTTFLPRLHLFETLANEIDPTFSNINTHPSSATRYRKLIDKYKSKFETEDADKIIAY